MKILQLTAENIKRIKVVQIKPDGRVVELTGRNGQGKTSVLDSIWWALEGTDGIQAVPIRKGESTGRIRLELGGEKVELIVERKFTTVGSYLSVINAEGFKAPAPQTLLDGLLSVLTLDPLRFMRDDPKAQAETLRRMTGLDLTELDYKGQVAVWQRREVKRDLANAIAALPPEPGPAPEIPDDPEQVAESIKQARIVERAVRDNELTLEDLRRNVVLLTDRIKTSANQIKDLEVTLEDEVKRHDGLVERLRDAMVQENKHGQKPAIQVPDTDALTARLRAAEQAVSAAKRWEETVQRRKEAQERVEKFQLQVIILEKDVKRLTEERRKRITELKLPVPELALTETGEVAYRGLPLEQASDAEQLRVSAGIAAALNPKLRVLRIRDGSLLDPEGLAALGAWAEEEDFQIWIERVGPSTTGGIVLEDGLVAGAELVLAKQKRS